MPNSPAFSGMSPTQAWAPLDRAEWNTERARHLLRRIGFSATPDTVGQALQDGLQRTIDRSLETVEPMPEPASITEFRQAIVDYRAGIRQMPRADEQRAMQAQFRRLQQSTYANYGVEWLRFASNPARSAAEKWTAFLQNILVVSYNTVRSPHILFDYQQTLRSHAFGPYPELVKAVSQSAAMIIYLNLQQNVASQPNENFARELFELFILGEGNYTERDIKEAARAFTGYRYTRRGFGINQDVHDKGIKTIFGQTGTWDGDDVIRFAFEQPAAATYLPTEMLRHYLSETPLPQSYIEELGSRWAARGFSLEWLTRTVFSSRLFYHPAFRGALIKAPNHFLIGLMQDLHLDIRPFNSTLNHLRAMGQPFFAPPNVRGWIGGKQWMNSGTVAARRQLVQQCFDPLNERRLNADDKEALDDARTAGATTFHVDSDRIERLAYVSPDELSRHLVTFFLPLMPSPEFNSILEAFLGRDDLSTNDRLRAVAISLLQSPYYHLS